MLPTFPGDFKNISCARGNSIIALVFRTTSRATNKQEIGNLSTFMGRKLSPPSFYYREEQSCTIISKTVEDIACNNPFV